MPPRPRPAPGNGNVVINSNNVQEIPFDSLGHLDDIVYTRSHGALDRRLQARSGWPPSNRWWNSVSQKLGSDFGPIDDALAQSDRCPWTMTPQVRAPDLAPRLGTLALVGPTCVGKTAAVRSLLDRYTRLEIINLDSFQVAQELSIGTGRSDGRYGARGHLYGVAPSVEMLAPAAYVVRAIEILREIRDRGNIPLFEGGSISYLRDLTRKIPLTLIGLKPQSNDWLRRAIRKRLDTADREELFEEIRNFQLSGRTSIVLQDGIVYAPVVGYLAGQMSWENAKTVIADNLIQMATKQLGSYDEFDIIWISTDPQLQDTLFSIVDDFLLDITI